MRVAADKGAAAMAALALFLAAEPAWARPTARLTYTRAPGAESCPDEGAMRTLVATRLGYDPFAPDAPVRVEASLTRAASGYRAVVRSLDALGAVKGQRELSSRGDDCAELGTTLAMTMSILLDPRIFLQPGAPPTRPARDSDDSPFTPERRVQPPPAPPAEPVAIRAGADVTGDLGAAPSVAAGAGVFVGVGRRFWSVDVEGRVDLPAQLLRPDGTGVRSSLMVGMLVPCFHADLFVGCSVVAMGALQGEGVNVGSPAQGATFYAAAGLRAGFEAPLSARLAIRLHTDLMAPLTRTTLSDRAQDVWTTPALYVATGVGVLGHFP
jgi:hypothetical protein